jgi:hypothetical protein
MKPIAALFLSLFASIATLCAQSYSVDWYTIDGGGSVPTPMFWPDSEAGSGETAFWLMTPAATTLFRTVASYGQSKTSREQGARRTRFWLGSQPGVVVLYSRRWDKVRPSAT